MNIVLTGYMASGKTAVGNYLSELCGLDFIDTDARIEEKCEMSISKIFEISGEQYFRHIESQVIGEVSGYDSKVISTGGGAVLNVENVKLLRANGIIVNLEPDEEVIRLRLLSSDSTRPLVKDSSMEEIIERFKGRKPYYDNCDVKIYITKDKSIRETAEEILKILEEKYEGEFRSGRK